jgi:hypothetical protein
MPVGYYGSRRKRRHTGGLSYRSMDSSWRAVSTQLTHLVFVAFAGLPVCLYYFIHHVCVCVFVTTADHFVCRDAHGLPLAQFSDFEDDDRVEQTLRAMASQTKTHLAWRFRQWYKNRKLLGAIAGPPLREVWDQIRSTPSLSATDKRRFTFYSCHDITILGLLYGVGASFLADDNNPEWLHYWPPYASTLVLELVRTDEDEHVVRILLDGQHVKSVDYNDPQFRPLSTAPDGLLQMEDFGRMVELLEEDGGSCARL